MRQCESPPTLLGVPWREIGPTVMEEAPRRRGDPGAASNGLPCKLERRLPPGEPAHAAQTALRALLACCDACRLAWKSYKAGGPCALVCIHMHPMPFCRVN